MNSEILKGKPLTKEESKCLLHLIEDSKIITTKTTNATNNKLKTEEWIRIAKIFNATATSCPRTPQQLRLKWENMKKNARKRSTKIRMNMIKTGGGPPDYIPPDDILDRVTSLLGSTVSGFTVPFGGDKEIVVDYVDGGGEGDLGIISGVGGNELHTEKDIEAVVTEVTDTVGPSVITPLTTKLTFNTPRAGNARKKFKMDESRSARNNAIANFYEAKTKCIDTKLININLENDNLKLNNEKLMLETEKLRLELGKLRNQQ